MLLGNAQLCIFLKRALAAGSSGSLSCRRRLPLQVSRFHHSTLQSRRDDVMLMIEDRIRDVEARAVTKDGFGVLWVRFPGDVVDLRLFEACRLR